MKPIYEYFEKNSCFEEKSSMLSIAGIYQNTHTTKVATWPDVLPELPLYSDTH